MNRRRNDIDDIDETRTAHFFLHAPSGALIEEEDIYDPAKRHLKAVQKPATTVVQDPMDMCLNDLEHAKDGEPEAKPRKPGPRM